MEKQGPELDVLYLFHDTKNQMFNLTITKALAVTYKHSALCVWGGRVHMCACSHALRVHGCVVPLIEPLCTVGQCSTV